MLFIQIKKKTDIFQFAIKENIFIYKIQIAIKNTFEDAIQTKLRIT